MKTVKQWLETLPEEYRDRAITNTLSVFTFKETITIKEDCLSEALVGSFEWDNTPEGFDYWLNLYESILDKEEFKH